MKHHQEIFAALLIFCQFINISTFLDLNICPSTLLPCDCGNTGLSIQLEVKQCSSFYKWEHRCNLCDNFNKESFCAKFKYCLNCDEDYQTCSTCNPDRYGQFCTGICHCQNGGTCFQPNGVCICHHKFEGVHCETKILASCASPENIFNGVLSISGMTEGSTVKYECNKGFILQGQNVRTCTEAGAWSPSVPACLPFCIKPKLSPNLIETVVELVNDVLNTVTSLLSGPSDNPIKSITYKCQDGFKLVGAKTINCKKNGHWSEPPPLCKKICLTPQPPINGSISGDSFIEGDFIEYNCNFKFLLNGSCKSTCQNDGTWSSATPMCLQRTYCPALDTIKYGERVIQDETGTITEKQIIFEGFKTIVNCNKDYILMGSGERTCQKSGSWSGDSAICVKWPQIIDCKTKGRDVIGEVGEFVRIDCPSGCFGKSNVIGTAIYSQNSLICRAALHIGKVTNKGGTFYVVNNGMFSPFVSSLLNGVQSLRASKPTISFRFEELEMGVKKVNNELLCPFGWELFENICLYFPTNSKTWNKAKIYCENVQGHLVILDQTDNHFALTTAMENKGISKVWIGLENLTSIFLWLDGKLLDDGEFDAWVQGEPEETKMCVYTSFLGWATEDCDTPLPFVCQFEIKDDKDILFCPNPNSIQNGLSSVDGLTNLDFSEGAIINYTCNQFYYLLGPNEIHCLENGSWSQQPKCLFVPSCPEPSIPFNGKIKHIIPPKSRQKRQISRRGNMVVFHPLNIGNTLHNKTNNETFSFKNETSLSDSNSELEDGTYISTNESFLFGDISEIDNGSYISPNETSLSKNISRNHEDKTIVKPNIWQFRNLRLVERISRIGSRNIESREESEVESIPDNLPIPPNHHRAGSKVVYECQSSFYELIGSKTTTCENDGKWTGNIPTCKQVCGKTSFPRPPLIINGNISQVGQWPWQVGLSMLQENKQQIFCGGTLLNKNWIVTAAHCVTFQETNKKVPMDSMSIYLGKHYRDNTKDDQYVKAFEVVDIIIPESYNPRIYDADIALIKLKTPVEFNHRIQPICLPSLGNLETTERLQEGKKGFVTGWGQTEDQALAEELRYATVPIVSTKKCEKEYNDAGMPFLITKNMYCAGFDEGLKDACSGDSGGPMVFQSGPEDSGTWTLEGIVSWGSPKGCAFPKQYGGYTRVERYIDWIDLHI